METSVNGLADRIRQVIDMVPKRTEAEFAAELGVSRGAVSNWLRGQPISPKNLQEICDTQGISEQWLVLEAGSMKDTEKLSRTGLDNRLGLASFRIGTLPIMVARDCGNGRLTVLQTDVFERIQMPPSLVGREDAYGLYVGGAAMSPAFRYGDTALVDPALPYSSDMEVVLYKDGEGECNAIICTLVSFTANEWVVEILKPDVQQFSLLRSEWSRCHRIVGKNARR